MIGQAAGCSFVICTVRAHEIAAICKAKVKVSQAGQTNPAGCRDIASMFSCAVYSPHDNLLFSTSLRSCYLPVSHLTGQRGGHHAGPLSQRHRRDRADSVGEFRLFPNYVTWRLSAADAFAFSPRSNKLVRARRRATPHALWLRRMWPSRTWTWSTGAQL